ncbi:MAG: hypothetical protein Q8Q14_03320 [Gemmatimonadales bacterium]|nr:hypothetical protein [Gemmatimonadales bacterium]
MAVPLMSSRGGTAQELTLPEILERNATALGGRARLDSLHSVVTLRTPTSLTSLKLPHFVLVEGFDSAGSVVYAEGYNGRQAWEQTRRDSARRVVTGRPESALRRVVQWPGNVVALYRLPEFGHALKLEGTERIASTVYYRIRLTLSDGFVRWYFVNAKTFLIERARDTRELHANDGNTREIETVFSDYRPVNGYRFLFTVFERDVHTGQRLFGRTVVAIFPNAELPDSLFDPRSRSDFARVQRFQSMASRSHRQAAAPSRRPGSRSAPSCRSRTTRCASRSPGRVTSTSCAGADGRRSSRTCA